MKCPRCQQDNATAQKFCGECLNAGDRAGAGRYHALPPAHDLAGTGAG